METFESRASSHDHLLLSYLEGHIRQAVMSRGPCAHVPALLPTSRNTHCHCCLASPSHSKAPPVKEAGSLEAVDHLGLPRFGLYKRIAKVLVLMRICHLSLVADLQNFTVISHPRTEESS